MALVDPDLLPPSFAQDVMGALRDNENLLDEARLHCQTMALATALAELGQADYDRAWHFWEKAAELFREFVRAELCSFYRQGAGGALYKIHPLRAEEDADEEHWPNTAREPAVRIEEPDFRQTWLIRFGAADGFPAVLKLQTRAAAPPIFAGRVAALAKAGALFFATLAGRFPKPEDTRKLDLFEAPGETDETQPILGCDPGFLAALKSAEQAAQSEASVYLKGESGCGKELFAKRLHQLSARADAPFIPINCSAIPHELIESEMFGHEKGAFTGAYYRKIGKVEQAHGGTLFLDEIGEMPLPFQAKLLRYLQEKKFSRVGGNQQVHSDARIVVATHRDLKDMVARGAFREDLYYRIHVIPIDIPPLRDRGRDIRLLSEIFFKRFISKSRASRRRVDETVFDALEQYEFPGNVRELENIIHRTVVMTQKSVISAEDLPEEIFNAKHDASAAFRLHPFEKYDRFVPKDRDTLRVLKKEIEYVAFSYQRDLDRRFLLRLLDENDGSARKAAESADINRTLFYKLLKRAGLDINLLKKGDA